MLAALEGRGYVQRAGDEDDRDDLINDATQKALERFDETMRELALLRYQEVEQELQAGADPVCGRRDDPLDERPRPDRLAGWD